MDDNVGTQVLVSIIIPKIHEQICWVQDAYALCRVFKKTAPGPKIIEHYGAVQHYVEQPQWTASSVEHHCSPTLDLSCDHVRGGDDFESNSSFSFPAEQAPKESMHSSGFRMQMSAPHEDGKWMQFLSEDAFNATNPFFLSPASSSFSCIPSKVDVALECAKLQHRLSLPPLEVEDFPHDDVSLDTKTDVLRNSNPNEVDILQEFLSVASASQELIHGSSSSCYAAEMWQDTGTSSHYSNELSSLVELGVKAKVEVADDFYHIGCAGTSSSDFALMSAGYVVDEPVRLVEISDMEAELKEEKKQVENLRVRLHNNDLGEIVVEGDDEINPTECITQYPFTDTADNSGEAGHLTDPTDAGGLDTAPIFSQAQPDDFAIGFDDDVDPRASSFHLYEEVDVKHGLFVSRIGAAKTFFHRVEPSKKVSFHLNPVAGDVSKVIEKFHFPKVSCRVSILSKLKALIKDKFLMMKPSSYQRSLGSKQKATGSSELLNIVTLLLTPKEDVVAAVPTVLSSKSWSRRRR